MKVSFQSNGLQSPSVSNADLGNKVTSNNGADFAATLDAAKRNHDDKALRESTTQMEAVMLNLMWKEMRATVPKSGLLPTGMAGEVYEDMLFQAYSDRMADTGMGLGEMLRRQLTQK